MTIRSSPDGRLDGRQDDRHAALQVEAEDRRGAGGDRADEQHDDDDDTC